MPELPEVETIVRELQAVMPRARVQRVVVGLPKMVKLPLTTFRKNVIGSRVRKVHRRAKLILIDLSSGHRRGRGPASSGDWTVLIHLKMSGQLIWQARRKKLVVGGHPIPKGTLDLPNKYSHVIFQTNRGTLYFNDQRQFGFVKLIQSSKLERWLEDQGYGPEPLADDFTFDVFQDLLKRHKAKRVKPTLMDQKVVAGIGNIYADEACHFAKIKPRRRIKTLTIAERRALYRGIRSVMQLSIKHKGTTADDYRTATGQKGEMLSFLRVYGRAGQRCKRCGGTIKKIALAQRGTHFCPNCQR